MDNDDEAHRRPLTIGGASVEVTREREELLFFSGVKGRSKTAKLPGQKVRNLHEFARYRGKDTCLRHKFRGKTLGYHYANVYLMRCSFEEDGDVV